MKTLHATPGQRYRFRAAARDGTLVSGFLAAPDIDAAREQLDAERLLPVSLEPLSHWQVSPKRISAGDLAVGTRVLAELLAAGLPLGKALRAFEDLAPDGWRPHIGRIREDVRNGNSLSSSLEGLGVVPPLATGMIRAGEIGGTVALALSRTAELLERASAARAALLGALAYPAFLALGTLGSFALLAGVVVPRFAALLTDLGEAVPASTGLLLAIATGAQRYGVLAAASLALVLVSLWFWTRRSGGRRRMHRVLLGVPIIGTIRHAWASAAACSAAGALLENGLPIAVALDHAATATGDSEVSARIVAARSAVIVGARPSDALEAEAAFTSVCLRLTKAGEETGALAAMLLRAAEMERERATRLTRTAIRAIEPSMILTFGGLVAFIAAALLQAVYAVRPGG